MQKRSVSHSLTRSADSFSDKLISVAKDSGVLIRERFFGSSVEGIYYSVCPECDANMGMLYQYYDQHIKQNLKYSDYGCMECDYGF